jgi:Outer membrane protein beta-barrel domain
MKSFVSAVIATATCASLAFGQTRANATSAPGQFAVDGSIGLVAPTFSNAGLGFDVMGAFEWHPKSTMPVAFRGEIGWDYFGYSGNLPTGYSASSNILRFDVDALYDIPVHWTSKLQPYLLGGLGIYHLSANYSCPSNVDNGLCGGGGSTTDLGLNLGGGLRYPFGPVAGFFELRWHEDFAGGAGAFFPFQFGVRYAIPK